MRVRGVLAALVASAVLSGCGGPGSADGGTETVTVFAAASLTDAFTTLARDFEADRSGTRLRLTFAGSSALATQINQGAPADVFASAAPAPMRAVTDAGNGDGTPVTFARNQLVIAVPKGNPAGVTGLADLTGPGVKVALCAEQVPCGTAARTALDAAGVTLTPVTLEQDVRGALAKVTLGEVDAALVYRTDVRGADDVQGVEFPESSRAVNDYPIVVLTDAANRSGARAFVDHVRSERGRAVLAAAGFQSP
ncbi:molybdate ABC transporter substrate-binding protein [Micromonospora sagamiensis]|uniref:Molybdate transport system substrate-binding protein n=1 Tax=Micromonospora sagamiensis TaxID=47875 RepID=A0A562WFR5_9ACTN|nr:molybdate ABC transporter substrate-binding protein [Micromonospora sagamiensis]TWJ29110.1 molybdate transport system substrate-binding protein [Micromonospora sagamiensis]BCL17865.1 molybdate-binding protein [Micromonospora sagamiensis]